ncbi:MAG: hypothetical protein M1840_007238 [Geoglossum simile]|nr:MAG: hypothetical protein M1840_007238 [Geoglossum simile]
MAKRSYGEFADNTKAEAQPPKRKKDERREKQPSGPVAAETITSSRQLQHLLSHSSDPALLRHGIQSLRGFLESIDATAAGESEPAKLRPILREYLESQKACHEDGEESVYMADLMQAWALASQSNNNSLLSAIPSVLARLLRTLSCIDEFRPHGVYLCKTLFQPARLKLIARNLTANNEYVISPSLRLLTEVVSFNAGSQAKLVNTHREFTFKGLGRNLNWTSVLKPAGAKQETVRTTASRFLLANFKFQNARVKSDLAGQRDIISALFKTIQEDPPDIIISILNVLKQEFLLDKEVQRSAKSRLLTPWTLGRLAALYNYVGPADDGNTMEKSVETTIHDFLLLVCTTPGLGVLLPDLGWYPPGSGIRHTEVDKDPEGSQGVGFLEHIGLELDHLEESNKYHEKIPVRNSTLSTFIQGLRPYANILQSQLLLAIFNAAPELVADYYILKRSFSFEPKLTSTWIGYSAFLFSTIQLPILEYCGLREGFSNRPPPIPIVIESILPQPLNQKVLTKCLNQKTKLIKFFSVRLLCVAFQKLGAVLDTFSRASTQVSALWKQASSKLLQEFCRRCPKMKDVITVFRSTAEEDVLQREAVARLLAVYYRLIPDIALNERFDVSIALANILGGIEASSDTAEDLGMQMLELEHLLFIAQCSPNIRWWNKPESLPLSAFTSILKLLVRAPATAPLKQIKALVQSVVYRTRHLQGETPALSLDALVNSLHPVGCWEPSDAVFEFLDNSILRYARKSTKYYDDFTSILFEEHGKSNGEVEVQPLSLLLMTLVEQWPFLYASKTVTESDKENVARWLARYMAFSFVIKENPTVLRTLCGRLVNKAGSGECHQNFQTLDTRFHHGLSIDILLDPQIDHAGNNLSGTNVSTIINTDWQVRMSCLDLLSSKLQDVQGEATIFDILLAWHVALDNLRKDSVSDRIASSLIEKVMHIIERIVLRLRRTDTDGHSMSKVQKLLCSSDGLKGIFFCPDVNKKFRKRTISTQKGYARLLQLAFDNYQPDLEGVSDSFVAGFRHRNTKDRQWHHLTTLLESLIHLVSPDAVLLMARTTIDEDFESGEGLSDKSAMLLPICLKKLLVNSDALPEANWRRLVCLPIRQKTTLDTNGSLIGCILENVGREGAVRMLTSDDIRTLFRNVSHGHGSTKVLRSVYSRLPDLPGQNQGAMGTYDSRMNKLFRQLLEDGRADDAIDILEMRLAASATPNSEKGWQWKDDITRSKILEAQAQYTKLQDTLLEGFKDGKRCCLLEIGVYLFKGAHRSKLVDLLDSYTWHIVTTPLFRLLLALGRTVASAREQEILKRLFSRICVNTTKDLSINDRLSDQLSDLCANIGRGFSPNPVPKTLFDPVLLNALLEVIFRKHIDGTHSTLLAASIVATDIVEDVDFRKFLQIILSHPRNPLRDHSITSRSRLNISYITGRLFHASPASQANLTTIQQVLVLTRGSNGVEDSVLESISAACAQTNRKILSNRTTSYSFLGEGEDRLFRYVNGKLHISISPRRLALTISHYPTDRPCRFHGGEQLEDFLTDAGNVDNIHSDTYSHFFLYNAIADWIHHEDDLFDFHEAIESGCVGFIVMGLCSTDLNGRKNALRILEALVAKLLISRYPEKGGAVLLIRALAHTAKGVIDKNRIPTPLAIFAARALLVQSDPLHCLYPKVNEFLLLGPVWDLGKVPLFHTTLLQGPTVDDCHYQEVSWMLENLASGLRTVEDLNMYRRNHYFEHLCSLYWSPYLSGSLKTKILDILSATTEIEGGSTTLITRAGVMDWIAVQLHTTKGGDGNDVTLRRLAKRLYQTCNREHVDAWSTGSMATRVQMMIEQTGI